MFDQRWMVIWPICVCGEGVGGGETWTQAAKCSKHSIPWAEKAVHETYEVGELPGKV